MQLEFNYKLSADQWCRKMVLDIEKRRIAWEVAQKRAITCYVKTR